MADSSGRAPEREASTSRISRALAAERSFDGTKENAAVSKSFTLPTESSRKKEVGSGPASALRASAPGPPPTVFEHAEPAGGGCVRVACPRRAAARAGAGSVCKRASLHGSDAAPSAPDAAHATATGPRRRPSPSLSCACGAPRSGGVGAAQR